MIPAKNLSPLQRCLCIVGTLGRRKKAGARGTMGREEARHAFYFSIIASSSLGCPVGGFAEEREKRKAIVQNDLKMFKKGFA